MRSFAALAISAIAVFGQAQPPRDSPPVNAVTGIVRGRVVAAETRGPIRRARVTLLGVDLPPVFSDADGRFTIEQLKLPRYSVEVTKPGYVPYRRSKASASAIDVAAG